MNLSRGGPMVFLERPIGAVPLATALISSDHPGAPCGTEEARASVPGIATMAQTGR
jgi:hypothetical protein